MAVTINSPVDSVSPIDPILLDWFKGVVEDEEIDEILAFGSDCTGINTNIWLEAYQQYKSQFLVMILQEAKAKHISFDEVIAMLIVKFCVLEIAFYVKYNPYELHR